jgi:Ribbon-helix-helix protein, copG family
MDKARISITVDPGVLGEIDREAAAAGMSRSAWVEKISHEAHLRAWIASYRPPGGVEELPSEQLDRLHAVREQWAGKDAR